MPNKMKTNLYPTITNICGEEISITFNPQHQNEENNPEESTLTNISINESLHFEQLVSNNDLSLITVLNLEHCYLYELTMDLSRLKLIELNVSKNMLTEIPVCLYVSLDLLQSLNLSHNKIQDFVEAPRCTGSIVKMDLSQNCFKELPAWIFTKECKLKELVYSMNPQICSLSDDKIKPLNYSIKTLTIQNCQIVEKDLNYFKSFTELTYLNLSNKLNVYSNFIQDPNNLFALLNLQSHLKVLLLNKLLITDLPEKVKNFSDLEELHLEFNNLSYLNEGLLDLKKLRVLKVGHNRLYKFPDLQKLKNLEVIEAQNNYLSKVDFRLMPSLKYLDLYHNEISLIKVDQTIEMIDLELNYINTNTVEICVDYVKKCEKLRENSAIFGRSTGCLVEDDYVSDPKSSYSDNEDECEAIVENEAFQIVDDEEDWDEFYNKNKEVTLSDSEYCGEVVNRTESKSLNSNDDDLHDYLYEDAD